MPSRRRLSVLRPPREFRLRLTAIAALAAPVLLGSATVGCVIEKVVEKPSSPTGTLDGTMTFRSDGQVEIEALVRVQMFGTDEPQKYTLGEIRIEDGTFGAAWTIDEIQVEPGGWPAVVDGALAFETRSVLVRAHSPGFQFVVEPRVTAEVVRDGATETASLLGSVHAEFELCQAPPVEPIPAALGGELAWSAETLPNLANQVLALEVDPLGRSYFATDFLLTPSFQGGVRVFGTTAAGIEDVLEVTGDDVGIAPGSGAGPTIATIILGAPTAEMLGERITRYDAHLKEVWSHHVSQVNMGSTRVQIAASNGRVAALVNPTTELVIDGTSLGPEAGPTVVLFDEATGDVIEWKQVPKSIRIEGVASGFVLEECCGPSGIHQLVGVTPDLTETFRSAIDDVRALAVGPDGTIWVSHPTSVAQYGADGALLRTLAAPLHGSLAPLADGTVLVATQHDEIALVAEGEDPIVSGLPAPAASWCAATSPFVVASSASGPVFVARPSTIEFPGVSGLAILGAIQL